MEKKVVFLGGTYREFANYCLERGINRHHQVFVNESRHIRGYCLCEDCCEIVWGTTERITSEVREIVIQYIARGHLGG